MYDTKLVHGDMHNKFTDMKVHYGDMKFIVPDMQALYGDMKLIIADMNVDVVHVCAALTYLEGNSPRYLAAHTAIMSHRPQHPLYCSFVNTFILPCP